MALKPAPTSVVELPPIITDYILPPTATLAELDYAQRSGCVTNLQSGYCRVRLLPDAVPTASMFPAEGEFVIPGDEEVRLTVFA